MPFQARILASSGAIYTTTVFIGTSIARAFSTQGVTRAPCRVGGSVLRCFPACPK